MNIKSDLTNLASFIEQAALDPHLSNECLNDICEATKHFNFSGLCTNLVRLPLARKRLSGQTQIKLITLIGFPFGFIPNKHKIAEAEWAAEKGADELELVPNFLALEQNKIDIFAEEVANVCEIGLPVRVILDMKNLNEDKLSLAIDASIDAGAIGLQNGNGFGGCVEPYEIQHLSNLVRGRCAIKAVGGLKTLDQTLNLIEAGVDKIGTSIGPQLIQSLKLRNSEFR